MEHTFRVGIPGSTGEDSSGPLALLWQLIEGYQVSIFQVSLSRITRDFLEWISENRSDIPEMAEFAAMASRLIFHKSMSLLPDTGPQSDQEPDSLPADLIEQLLEYKKYQMAAESLRAIEQASRQCIPRAPDWGAIAEDLDFLEVDLISLLKAYQDVLNRMESREPMAVETESIDIEGMMALIQNKIHPGETLSFFAFARGFTTELLVVAFLALLELIRLRLIRAEQDSYLGDIEIAA